MNDVDRAKYRALVEKECNEMRIAAGIWGRVDIDRDEKLRLFNECHMRVIEYERDAQNYIDSIIAGIARR